MNSRMGAGASKPSDLLVTGFSVAAVGLVVFLTVNDQVSVSGAAFVVLAGLIIAGLLLPAAGMFWLRRTLFPVRRDARRGSVLQGLGMVGLFLGLLPVVATHSLSVYFVSSGILTVSGASALAGAVLLGRDVAEAGVWRTRDAWILFLAIVMIFSGVGLIVGSNIANEYWISDLTKTVYIDVGASISACGSVLAAHSFFVLRSSS